MSVRQYIGARYVTKVYENSLDPSSAEWESGRSYEPLTLVTYLNSSYLSKKEVPASVGDPASNPTYWVITGAYNGQIATLQSQIDALNISVNSLLYTKRNVDNKKILIIGDSVSDPAYAALQPNWVDHFEAVMTAFGSTVDNNSVSARCIASNLPDSPGGIAEAIPGITDTYDIIIVELGINDWSREATPTQIKTAIDTFAAWCDTNQQTAQIFWITPLSPNQSNRTKLPALVVRNLIIKHCTAYRWNVIDMYSLSQDYRGNDSTLRTRWTLNGDSYHPNPAYAPYYADLVINSIMFGTNLSYPVDTSAFNSGIPCLSQMLVYGDGRIIIQDNTGSYTPATTQVMLGTLPEWARPAQNLKIPVFAHDNFDLIMLPTGAVYGLFASAGVAVNDIKFTYEYTPASQLGWTN